MFKNIKYYWKPNIKKNRVEKIVDNDVSLYKKIRFSLG
jgi:hypothetical protein